MEKTENPLGVLPEVIVDSDGKYKYITVEVTLLARVNGFLGEKGETSKILVRGALLDQKGHRSEAHGEIFKLLEKEVGNWLEETKTHWKRLLMHKSSALGGWIEVKGSSVIVSGESGDFGRADHAATVEAIKPLFPPGYSFQFEELVREEGTDDKWRSVFHLSE